MTLVPSMYVSAGADCSLDDPIFGNVVHGSIPSVPSSSRVMHLNNAGLKGVGFNVPRRYRRLGPFISKYSF